VHNQQVHPTEHPVSHLNWNSFNYEEKLDRPLQDGRAAWQDTAREVLSDTDVNRRSEPLFQIFGLEEQDLEELTEFLLNSGPKVSGLMYTKLKEGIRSKAGLAPQKPKSMKELAKPGGILREPVRTVPVSQQSVASHRLEVISEAPILRRPRRTFPERTSEEQKMLNASMVQERSAWNKLIAQANRENTLVLHGKGDEVFFRLKGKDYVNTRLKETEVSKELQNAHAVWQAALIELKSTRSVANKRIYQFQRNRKKAKKQALLALQEKQKNVVPKDNKLN
jgi:hypothetical protein